MRTTLDPERAAALHLKAARWFEETGLLPEAVKHALASGNLDEAERVICLAAEEELHGAGLLMVGGWLDALPDERVRAHADLAVYRGWLLAMIGNLETAAVYADAAEERLRRVEAPGPTLAKLLVLRANMALIRRDYARAIEDATAALEGLQEERPHWRIVALWALAESRERTSHIAGAIETFRQARNAARALDNQVFGIVAEISLALSLNTHGRRREAVAVCEEAIEQYIDGVPFPSPVAGLIFSRMALFAYEANQLEQSRAYHERALALIQQIPLDYYLSMVRGLAALTLHAVGETDAALEALQGAYQTAAREESFVDADLFLDWEAGIRLRQGDVAFVQRWAEKAGLSPDDEPDYLHIERHLVYARLLPAQGRLSDAQRWLCRLAQFTWERGLYRFWISVRIMQALTAERLGDHSAAREHLARALEIAAPEDYYRAFLDEDEQVVAMLPGVRRAAPAFVDQLLRYAGIPRTGPAVSGQPLVEPLSERELEVLGLIAAGLSNREIAERLVIAGGTVKRHINNIYGKLAVRSRTQAIAKAHALRLLQKDT